MEGLEAWPSCPASHRSTVRESLYSHPSPRLSISPPCSGFNSSRRVPSLATPVIGVLRLHAADPSVQLQLTRRQCNTYSKLAASFGSLGRPAPEKMRSKDYPRRWICCMWDVLPDLHSHHSDGKCQVPIAASSPGMKRNESLRPIAKSQSGCQFLTAGLHHA